MIQEARMTWSTVGVRAVTCCDGVVREGSHFAAKSDPTRVMLPFPDVGGSGG
jgi:hypothetical protein